MATDESHEVAMEMEDFDHDGDDFGGDGVDDLLNCLDLEEGSILETVTLQEDDVAATPGSHFGHRGAPGGPLAVPGFVSGRINVGVFQQSCGALLSALKAELDEEPEFMDDGDLDLSVDDLKIMTDAVLVERALTDVLQGQDSLSVPAGRDARFGSPGERTDGTLGEETCRELEETQSSPQGTVDEDHKLVFNFSIPPKTGKKRGRPFDRDQRASQLTDDADARRREALAKMKKERDLAKEQAALHSLRAKSERENLYAKDQRPLRTVKFLTSTLKTPKLACKEEFEPMKEGEVLLTVEVYDNIKKSLKTQEFIVCGSQPLTALKDRIYCLTDTLAEKAHVKVPSGYFLIEECFYNDMRQPNAIDYSLPIIKWVKEKAEASEKWKAVGDTGLPRKRRALGSNLKSTLPPSFLAAKMAETSFVDIECRLGAQFLYCHQGDCKHTIIIRDLRLVHPQDVQNAAAYPVLRYVNRFRHRKCTICGIYRASKVTLGDKLAPENPCFFCETCYYMLHYSIDGNILYSDFGVHDYFHE